MKRQVIEVNGHSVETVDFRNALVRWGKRHFRKFPWRLTEDPYGILMAELMLHRTPVAQVTHVYTQFMSSFPDLQSLTAAPKKSILGVLQSLGLRWRIDLVLLTGENAGQGFRRTIPETTSDLCRLPNVSDYIASAIRCFAFGHAEPLIDTNTVRITGRLFGLEIKESSRRNPVSEMH